MATDLSECKLAVLLQGMKDAGQRNGDVSLSFVAKHALNILADMHSEYVSPADIDSLANLLSEIQRSGGVDLESFTAIDALNCPVNECNICAALAHQFASMKR